MKERTWLPGWTVERRAFDPAHTAKTESIYAQGNGYINVRCAEDERYVGQTRGTFATLTFNKALPDEVQLYSLRLHETATSFAEWFADDNL